jgi:hypothetical protein
MIAERLRRGHARVLQLLNLKHRLHQRVDIGQPTPRRFGQDDD